MTKRFAQREAEPGTMRGLAAGLIWAAIAATPAMCATGYNDITFFLASDLHYGFSNATTISATNDLGGLGRMNVLPGTAYPPGAGGGSVDPPRGVLLIGDLTDDGSPAEWMAFTNDWGLNGDAKLAFPVYEALGNHEYYGTAAFPGIKGRNPLRTGVSNISNNGYHYSWDWDSLHLVCLNLFPGDFPEDNLDPMASLSFLVDDLARNVGKSGRPVVIYHHYGFDSFSLGWWREQQRTNYFEAIKNYNVIAIFSGHNHAVDYIPWRGVAAFNDGNLGKPFDSPITGNFLVAHLTSTRFTVVERTAASTWGVLYSLPVTLSNSPTIVAGPQPVSAPVGSSVTMSVQAIGPSLSYQWFFRCTNAIPGATNSLLSLEDVTLPESGPYSVVVANPADTVAPPPAVLTVLAPLDAATASVLAVTGSPENPLTIEYTDTLFPAAQWSPLTTLAPSNSSPMFLELGALDQPQRFYRAPAATSLMFGLVPALTVRGDDGMRLRLEYQDAADPSGLWQTLATLNPTGTSQRYLDNSALGQPPRIYRAVAEP